MLKHASRFGLLCLLVLAAGAVAVSAQSPIDDQRDQRQIKAIETNLPTIAAQAGKLERYAVGVLLMAITVGLLGIISAALPHLTRTPKWLATTMGIVIAALTLINTVWFIFDYKTLKSLGKDGHDAVQTLPEELKNYQLLVPDLASPDARKAAEATLQNVARLQQDLNNLEARANEGGYTLGVNKKQSLIRATHATGATAAPATGSWMPFFTLPVALAQAGKPDWLGAAPSDANRVGTVGIGGCTTVTGAREMARYNAIESVARNLIQKYPRMDLDLTMNALERNAQEARNYFYRDANGVYWHSMLLFFQRGILGPDLIQPDEKKPRPVFHVQQSFPAPSSGTVALTVKAAANNPDDGSFEFVLAVSPENRGSRLALQGLATHQDGSLLTTRWIFRLRANGQEMFTIPLHRYEDEGHPTRCVVREEEKKAWRQAMIPASPRQITVDIDALKP